MTQTRKRSAAKSRPRATGASTTTWWALGAGLSAAVLGAAAVLLRRRLSALLTGTDGHAVPDLAADAPRPGTTRAVEHFRPDPTAVPTAEERDALRPATGPAPSLVADRGEMRMQTGVGSARSDIAVASESA